jgi:putative component of membrane protein insertase Oxa1/YidC/SpoIIIJ protein YidD
MQTVHIIILKYLQMRKLLKCSFCFIFLIGFYCKAQVTKPYITKIIENADNMVVFEERKVIFGLTDRKKVFLFYNPIHLSLAGSMYFYQKHVSRQLPSSCLYNPSCSEYSKQLIGRYGIIKGAVCSSDRLMRCNRLTATSISSDKINKHDHKVHESIERYNNK